MYHLCIDEGGPNDYWVTSGLTLRGSRAPYNIPLGFSYMNEVCFYLSLRSCVVTLLTTVVLLISCSFSVAIFITTYVFMHFSVSHTPNVFL